MQNEEFHELYTSPNTTRIIQSRRMRRTDRGTRTEKKRNAHRVLKWEPARRDDVDVIGIDGIILLETFKEQNGVVWIGLNRQGALVNTVMNLWNPQMQGSSRGVEEILPSQEARSSLKKLLG